jgi:hypothetical protein
VASPMPLEAPVTTATLPFRLCTVAFMERILSVYRVGAPRWLKVMRSQADNPSTDGAQTLIVPPSVRIITYRGPRFVRWPGLSESRLSLISPPSIYYRRAWF